MTPPRDGPPGPQPPAPRRLRPEIVAIPIPASQAEIHQDGAFLVATYHLPNHGLHDLKYHVGRRTLTLWSRKEGHEFQSILVLPKWVHPESFILLHKNGLFELVVRVDEDPPGLPPAA